MLRKIRRNEERISYYSDKDYDGSTFRFCVKTGDVKSINKIIDDQINKYNNADRDEKEEVYSAVNDMISLMSNYGVKLSNKDYDKIFDKLFALQDRAGKDFKELWDRTEKEVRQQFKKESFIRRKSESNKFFNFQRTLDDYDGTVMTITANNGYYVIAEISDCGNMSEKELDNLADEVLKEQGLIKDSYFSETKKPLRNSLRRKSESYYVEDSIDIDGSINGYNCCCTITYHDGLFGYEEDIIGNEVEPFTKDPVKAFNTFMGDMEDFMEGTEENIDNPNYVFDFDFPDDVEERLDKFGYACYKQRIKDESRKSLRRTRRNESDGKTYTVYKVFDSDWEDIMGLGQMREFCIDQIMDKAEDFIYEAKEGYQDKVLGRKIEELYNKIIDETYTDLTLDEIKSVFKAFDFDYKLIQIY